MTKYNVTAIAIDPEHPNLVSPARVEEIDTEDNPIFAEATGPWDIEDLYHGYWNRLNDSWEYGFPRGKEKVLVIKVEQA